MDMSSCLGMRPSTRNTLLCSLLAGAALGLTLPLVAASNHPRPSSSHLSVKHRLRKSSHGTLRHAESPAMAAERTTQIQTALIQKGYLSGSPTGNWDAPTVSAMQRLQADNGWQHKVTPDARALIKLGLGPMPQAAAPTAPSPPR